MNTIKSNSSTFSSDYGSDKPFKDYLESKHGLLGMRSVSREPSTKSLDAIHDEKFSPEHASTWLKTHDKVLLSLQKNLHDLEKVTQSQSEKQTLAIQAMDDKFETLHGLALANKASHGVLSEDLEKLGPRLDALATDIDSISMNCARTQSQMESLKAGSKRKMEQVDDLVKDIDLELDQLDGSIQTLQERVELLDLQMSQMKREHKRQRQRWVASAAVGACTALAVTAGVVFGPDWM